MMRTVWWRMWVAISASSLAPVCSPPLITSEATSRDLQKRPWQNRIHVALELKSPTANFFLLTHSESACLILICKQTGLRIISSVLYIDMVESLLVLGMVVLNAALEFCPHPGLLHRLHGGLQLGQLLVLHVLQGHPVHEETTWNVTF